MKKLRAVFLVLLILVFGGTLSVYAQSSSGDFTYEVNGESLTITSYTGADQKVTIPAVINEKKVTAIGDYAFMLCNTVEKINVPSTVKNISATAFTGANKLKEVVLASEDTVINQTEENKKTESDEKKQTEASQNQNENAVDDKSEGDKQETAYQVTVDKSVDELAGTNEVTDTIKKSSEEQTEQADAFESQTETNDKTGGQTEIAGMGDDETDEATKVQNESGKKNTPVILIIIVCIFVVLLVIYFVVKKRKHRCG